MFVCDDGGFEGSEGGFDGGVLGVGTTWESEIGSPHFGHRGLRPGGMCEGSFKFAWHLGQATVWDMGFPKVDGVRSGEAVRDKSTGSLGRISVTPFAGTRNRRSWFQRIFTQRLKAIAH